MEETVIKLNGKVSQICKQLQSYGINLDEAETQKLLRVILDNKEYLQADEMASMKVTSPNLPKGCIGFMTMDYNYHISIKKLTLCALAFVADKLTRGISEKILDAFGISFKAINSIDDASGEKCIVKETVLYHKKVGNEGILEKFKGKCCNNDLRCKFRSGEICNCKKADIKEIYERLVDKGVFKKVDLGYKLRW